MVLVVVQTVLGLATLSTPVDSPVTVLTHRCWSCGRQVDARADQRVCMCVEGGECLLRAGSIGIRV